MMMDTEPLDALADLARATAAVASARRHMTGRMLLAEVVHAERGGRGVGRVLCSEYGCSLQALAEAARRSAETLPDAEEPKL